jgi:hypothetical protein
MATRAATAGVIPSKGRAVLIWLCCRDSITRKNPPPPRMLLNRMINEVDRDIAVISTRKGTNMDRAMMINDTRNENSNALAWNKIFFCVTAAAAESSAEHNANISQVDIVYSPKMLIVSQSQRIENFFRVQT